MKFIRLYTYLFLTTGFFFTSCKVDQPISSIKNKALPNSYFVDSALSESKAIKWRDYFSDDNLIGLIDTALANNLDALIALQRIESARAGVQFRKGALLPTINGATGAAVRRYGLYTMDGAGNISTEITPGQIVPINLPDYFVGLQSAWEIDVFGKLRNRKKAAVARYLSSIEGKHWLTTNIIAEVASYYYELLALDNELSIVTENIQLQQNALEVVIIQKEAGAANELAVKQFKAQLLNTKSLEVEIKQNIIETENRINFLLGRFNSSIHRSERTFNDSTTVFMKEGVPSDLLRNRPDIKQAELELLAAKADFRSAKAAFYPMLNITGSAGFQAFKTNLLFTTPESFIFTLVGGLTAPLINRSAIQAEFKAANAAQIEALYNYQKSILNGYLEVNTQLNNIQNLNRMYSLRTEEVKVLSEAIGTSSELFRTGRASYLEVLVAQQNTLAAKLDFVNVRKRQLLSSVNIYKALGGGWQ